jgi:hypothetical protein
MYVFSSHWEVLSHTSWQSTGIERGSENKMTEMSLKCSSWISSLNIGFQRIFNVIQQRRGRPAQMSACTYCVGSNHQHEFLIFLPLPLHNSQKNQKIAINKHTWLIKNVQRITQTLVHMLTVHVWVNSRLGKVIHYLPYIYLGFSSLENNTGLML